MSSMTYVTYLHVPDTRRIFIENRMVYCIGKPHLRRQNSFPVGQQYNNTFKINTCSYFGVFSVN